MSVEEDLRAARAEADRLRARADAAEATLEKVPMPQAALAAEVVRLTAVARDATAEAASARAERDEARDRATKNACEAADERVRAEHAEADAIDLRAEIKRQDSLIDNGIRVHWRSDVAALERTISAARDALPDTPPAVGIEPLDAAVRRLRHRAEAAESARDRALEALWACRAGDGCLCSGGPFTVAGPQPHGHSARCRAWMAALTDDQRRALAGEG